MIGFAGPEPPPHLLDLIDQGLAGLVLFARNVGTPAEVASMLQPLQDRAARAGYPPLLVSIDHEGGRVQRLRDGYTALPPAMAVGAAADEGLAYALASAAGAELRSAGVNVNLAPCADLNSNPANPVIGTRSYGDDAVRVGAMVAATVRGYQDQGVLATVKHFPGHGDTHQDSHLTLPRIDRQEARFRQYDLVPFVAAVQAGVAAVMSAHIVVPWLTGDAPATLCRRALRGLLRDELGFQGIVMTDCMEMRAIADNQAPGDATVAALRAGADLVLWSHTAAWQLAARDAIGRAMDRGELDERDFAAAAARVRDARERAGAARPWRCGRSPGPGGRRQPAGRRGSCGQGGDDAAQAVWRASTTLAHGRAGALPPAAGPGTAAARAGSSHASVCIAADRTGEAAAAALVAELTALGVQARLSCGQPSPAGGDPPSDAPAACKVVYLLRDEGPGGTGCAVPGGQAPGPADIVVATGLPYVLSGCQAAGAAFATYSQAGGAMRALAEVLAGRRPPAGRLPVRLGQQIGRCSDVMCGLEPAEKARREAGRLHKLGYNCAESVLGAVAEAAGMAQPPLRLATGFGGGIGRTGDVCGAVTGAVMALGWARGRDDASDKEGYARLSQVVRQLLADFRAAHGHLNCSPLTGYDLSDPAVLPKFAEDVDRRAKCAVFIETAAKLAAAALARE
jgi:beta-N-acetylhexosaminidase